MLLALEAAALGHADLRASEELANNARSESGASESADAQMLVAAVSAGVASAWGRLDTALGFAYEAEGLRELGSPASQSSAQWFVAFCMCPVDRLHEAEELFRLAYQAGEDAGSAFDMSLAEASRAAALLALGRLDDAMTTAESASDIPSALRLGLPLGEALRVLAEVHVRRGDLAAAKVVVRRLQPLLASGAATATATWGPALLAEAQGDASRGLDALEEPIALLADHHYRLGVPDPPQLAHVAAMGVAAGKQEAALVAADAAEHLCCSNRNTKNLAGVAAHARGVIERDEPLLRRAVELLSVCERPLATAAAREDLAALHADRDEKDEAIAGLSAAHDAYAACGAELDAARVRGRLRRLGARVRRPFPSRPANGWEGLTPSELAVCRSVAEGLSSNDVAARLYLSVNTVNTHLRHAFTKLAIRSRVELTRIVMTHDSDVD
jgi:DNA-binding CsgD family transcriptional regulator/tetratricopeptide (TPR) repeat protein